MKKTGIIAFTIILGVAAVLGFFLIPSQYENEKLSEPASKHTTSLDLGMTYLQLTPQLSAYYGIEAESGALVTEVLPDSPAERAGVREGDVIIAFNDARLENEASLLGMMMACPAGHKVMLEVMRDGNFRSMELYHVQR